MGGKDDLNMPPKAKTATTKEEQRLEKLRAKKRSASPYETFFHAADHVNWRAVMMKTRPYAADYVDLVRLVLEKKTEPRLTDAAKAAFEWPDALDLLIADIPQLSKKADQVLYDAVMFANFPAANQIWHAYPYLRGKTFKNATCGEQMTWLHNTASLMDSMRDPPKSEVTADPFLQIFKMMLDSGLDPDAKTSKGLSVLDVIRKHTAPSGFPFFERLFIERATAKGKASPDSPQATKAAPLMGYPKRFCPVDILLHEAVNSLDTVAIRQAAIDGARTELLDLDGNTALWQLLRKVETADMEKIDEKTVQSFIACLDALMECGGGASVRRYDPVDGSTRKYYCRPREHDCDGCTLTGTYSGDIDPDDECDSETTEGWLKILDCRLDEYEGHPLDSFFDALWDWIRRQRKDKGLQDAFIEKIVIERMAKKVEHKEEKPKGPGDKPKWAGRTI
jgi:hypothetical protein